jgi:peptidyl-prolyl cis-trans isomerase D
MSVIQNLRTKYAKIVGGLIGVSLVGFILMDASNGPLQSLFGRDTSVAKVNGNKIDAKDYQQRMADYELLVPLFSKGKPMDEATRAQIKQQVLDEMVYEQLVATDMDRLGIMVTDAELKDLTHGNMPDPMVQQFPYFADQQSGQFNPQMIAAFEQQVPQIQDGNQRQRLLDEWAATQRFVARSRRLQKYNALLMSGVYTPGVLAKKAMEEGSQMASVRFVKLPFVMIPDAEVKVTDADLNTYLNAHKDQYTIDQPVRSIEYVTFDVLPSAEDTLKSLGTLRNLAGDFATTADAESFVNRNSEIPYSSRYITKKMMNAPGADSILDKPVGAIVGPYYESGSYQMVRILDKKQLPDSVKAQHILLAANQNRDDSAAHKLADSLVAAIRAGASFDTLARRYSDDASNKEKGGDLGYFAQGMMVPEFNEVAFDGTTGDLKTVKTQFGWHILRINDQKNFETGTKLAVVVKSLQPGQATNDAAYNKAVEFAGKNSDGKAFDAAVTKQGLQRKLAENIRQNDFSINGLGASRELISWAWDDDRKAGAVSTPFSIDGRYVVAKLSGIKDAGLMTLDASSRPQIEALVKAQKKGDLLLQRYGKMQSLDAVATASKQAVMTADSFSMANPFAPNLGFEPKVIGYSFYPNFKENATSPAIRGNDGVFFLSLTHRFSNPMPALDKATLEQQKMSLTMQLRQAMGSALQQAAMRNAKITYNSKML